MLAQLIVLGLLSFSARRGRRHVVRRFHKGGRHLFVRRAHPTASAGSHRVGGGACEKAENFRPPKERMEDLEDDPIRSSAARVMNCTSPTITTAPTLGSGLANPSLFARSAKDRPLTRTRNSGRGWSGIAGEIGQCRRETADAGQLPHSLKLMPDDAYRSLAGRVRKNGGFCRSEMKQKEFAEFVSGGEAARAKRAAGRCCRCVRQKNVPQGFGAGPGPGCQGHGRLCRLQTPWVQMPERGLTGAARQTG